MYSIFKIRRTEAEWQQRNGIVLFTWSIINPNGPTLSCVGLRNTGCPGQLEIFYRWFHFYGGESFVLGYVSEDSVDLATDVSEALRYAFSQERNRVMQRFPLVTCVPSFVTLPDSEYARNLIGDEDVRNLVARSRAFKEADWGREMYYLKKYGSQFFDRAGEETREAVERISIDPSLTEESRQMLEITRIARGHIPSFSDWEPNRYTTRALNESDVAEWWSTITEEEFEMGCLRDIAQAWVGAIHQASSAEVTTVEPFDLVKEFLEFHGCHLWPEEWDSAFLLERMGLIA